MKKRDLYYERIPTKLLREDIRYLGTVLGEVIKNQEGIKFFTPNDFSQQLGYMKRDKGYEIMPHVHNPVKRNVYITKEVLFDDALIKPHEPSSKENLIPLTVKISAIV